MRYYDSIGVQIPRVYLPRKDINLQQWAVIACDQFTSQPEYWRQVEQIVGTAPSTLRMILPEVYLEEENVSERINAIHQHMQDYLDKNILEPIEAMIYVERTVEGKTRRGILLALDLERYDYMPGSQSLVRATEGTIIERLPPRIKIRRGAPLEVPHILVLIDDPQRSVIEPLSQRKGQPDFPKLYDFDLMLDSGHVQGYAITNPADEAAVIAALEKLAQPQNFAAKYGVPSGTNVLLFAVGDGNHSLATAKAYWEEIKSQVGPNHPARYALVEIENLYDEGLVFEPIHRILFNLKSDVLTAMHDYFGEKLSYQACHNFSEMVEQVERARGSKSQDDAHYIGLISSSGVGVTRIASPTANLPVGTLQPFLDSFLKAGQTGKIDYIHGDDVIQGLACQPGNVGFYLPAMDKSELFKTVILDGTLPRKTFSMGEAKEKRFYIECRKIVE